MQVFVLAIETTLVDSSQSSLTYCKELSFGFVYVFYKRDGIDRIILIGK